MRTIYTGTIYDTDKAIEVGGYDNLGDGVTATDDLEYWIATLYKNPRSGKYFLAGYGGPMTWFGRGKWRWKIVPVSREFAFEWAQKYLDFRTVKGEFNEIVAPAC